MKSINQLVANITALTSVIISSGSASGFEGAYYGTNYTAPFAHAYRALTSTGVDVKAAIDRDVYHLSRLGLNAFRLHLWDVELSDSVGNLLDNEHLDCLDYLISKLEERNISIILTAQTNFGNGYPERNSNPNNAYSYMYDKCEIHDNADAVRAQERYVGLLAKHTNKYTGRRLCDDERILAMEINNEPCHSGDKKAMTAYVKRMMKALRRAGWKKDILYNVSHNLDRTSAFFDAPIDGATFQWYPTGLVSGHQLKGNFLPFVDDYNIPFDSLIESKKVAKIVYEFDPADNLYSYLYPAAARTFRSAGFQWITQFAYDPMDIAWANTEYQTHYLNLAYTPGKALGMMIAAEVVRQLPQGADVGKYPENTHFGDFTIDARNDLAVLNDGSKYYYTNNSNVAPKDLAQLEHVAGRGTSPVVTYGGSGAYFLDKLSDYTWRLEVMPDVVLTKDPFARPSLKRKVGEIVYNAREITVNLSNLSDGFKYRNLSELKTGFADGKTFVVSPGIYLISSDAADLAKFDGSEKFGDGTKAISEFVAPQASKQEKTIVHTPTLYAKRGDKLTLTATVLGEGVDSVLVYPANVSFWRNDNRFVKMRDCGFQHYEAEVNVGDRPYGYNIVAFYKDGAVTYPGGVSGTPLEWDFAGADRYTTNVYGDGDELNLLVAREDRDGADFSAVADNWRGARFGFVQRAPMAQDCYDFAIKSDAEAEIAMLSKDISDIVASRQPGDDLGKVSVKLGEVSGFKQLYVGFVTKDGFTFKADLAAVSGVQTFKVSDFTLTNTINPRNVYPLFINRVFTPQPGVQAEFSLNDVDRLVLVGVRGDDDARAEIYGVTIDK